MKEPRESIGCRVPTCNQCHEHHVADENRVHRFAIDRLVRENQRDNVTIRGTSDTLRFRVSVARLVHCFRDNIHDKVVDRGKCLAQMFLAPDVEPALEFPVPRGHDEASGGNRCSILERFLKWMLLFVQVFRISG
ncbi:hypothetical protein PsorP6_017756 [Peronosclerospora sorghi]|uniref:Uncharacterized protein n=1 Tax=Peronosclerospora sorghi TaxID=230839 RepID=A0ACC0WPI5_9STRA|nr:hypothetical protein PsorP6_017756 [Peronosclerospora sorghi]